MKRRVLIVEDSPTIRALIRVHLTGYMLEFIEASDGAEGVEMARQQRPHVIIADLKMPKVDGFSLCRAVRADASLKNTPIILLTNSKGAAVEREARAAGATDFLTKPIDGGRLAELLKGYLS